MNEIVATWKGDGEELEELAKKVAEIQSKAKTMSFIKYEDEQRNVKKSRLVRGKNGIDANIELLEVLHTDHEWTNLTEPTFP